MSESSPPAQFDVSMALPSLLVAILAIGVYYLLSPKDKSSIRRLGGFPIVTAWAFFSRRYDFLWKHFKSSDTPHFKFQVLQVRQRMPLCSCGLLMLTSTSTMSLRYEEKKVAGNSLTPGL